MTTAPRCAECDVPLIVIDLYWLCPNRLCSRFGKYVRAVGEDDYPQAPMIRSAEGSAPRSGGGDTYNAD